MIGAPWGHQQAQNAHLVIGDSEEEALDKKRSELHLLPGDDCGHGDGLGGQVG